MKQPVPITLSNNAVTLIPMTIDHAQDFYEAGKHDDIWRWTPPHRCASLNIAKQWIAQSLALVTKGEQVMFGIVDNASGEFVGSTRYCSIDIENSGIEIGFTFINQRFQRSHINSNCKLLLLTHAFEELGAVRVQLRTHEHNKQSRKAIKRLGTTFEGILRSHRLLSTGEYRHTALFSLLNDEWPEAKVTLQKKTNRHLNKQDIQTEQKNITTPKLSNAAISMIQERSLAQILIKNSGDLHDHIIYLPLRLEPTAGGVLTGHLSIKNKVAHLLEHGADVTVVFEGGDAYISPLLHEKIKVPTWNYRRLHISGQLRCLSMAENKKKVTEQVEDYEGEQWVVDDQPVKLIDSMLANIRCFEISIERVDEIFKLVSEKPLVVRKAISDNLISNGQLSLAAAHLSDKNN